jgi:hypothetical protein
MIYFIFGLGIGNGDIANVFGVNGTTVDPELSTLRSGKKKTKTALKRKK